MCVCVYFYPFEQLSRPWYVALGAGEDNNSVLLRSSDALYDRK